ncbi:syntaxin-8-like isoform X2 [Tachypleus tridentatus]|uniref:syntaxin-8-like isoform X2 n=1 Tax=Tachypleus tridentatus TaxID=6853 RepID=UPI003FCFB85B
MAMNVGDRWFLTYNACEDKARDVMEKIIKRNQLQQNTSGYIQLNAQARQSMKQFSKDLNTLKEDLKKASSSYYITQREVERRQRLVEKLESKERQMEMIFSERAAGIRESRTALLGGQFTPSSGIAFGIEETNETKDLTVEEIKQSQQQVLREQDRGLEGLSNIITRQKQMAHHIGEELDLHNEIIDGIVDHTDTTKERLCKETRHIAIVDRKSNTCGYWVIIVILLIPILVIPLV